MVYKNKPNSSVWLYFSLCDSFNIKMYREEEKNKEFNEKKISLKQIK